MKFTKYPFTVFCSIFTVYCSCAQVTKNTLAGFEQDLLLIQTCVDSTLSLDRGLNGKKYLVDFSAMKFDRRIIDNFFRSNPNAMETNLDSLFAHDPTWIKYQFFKNPVIRFEEIKRQNNSTFLIKTSKTLASDGSIGTEIILHRKGDGFECLKSQITWIS